MLRARYAPKTNGAERHAVAFADLVADNRDIEVTPATYEIPISAPVLPSRKHMRQRANHHCRKGLGGLTDVSPVKPSEFIALELSVLAREERPCWT